jgi:hypothetical protein
MDTEVTSEPRNFFRSKAGSLLMILFVIVLVVAFPAYRRLFLSAAGISIAIGLAIAGGLMFWHRLRPLKEDDIHNRKPLGLE